ncbi:hypothetical protein [Hahella sp. CCB-MM4]|uniref:hypothetical protein n=1 Tax=Hahella sp. (strain CCB-MM4) TaxID=1926491 RepID=UPI00143DEDF1|nr:hypothetical protein [Hahella sp. CCB-MM4]
MNVAKSVDSPNHERKRSDIFSTSLAPSGNNPVLRGLGSHRVGNPSTILGSDGNRDDDLLLLDSLPNFPYQE